MVESLFRFQVQTHLQAGFLFHMRYVGLGKVVDVCVVGIIPVPGSDRPESDLIKRLCQEWLVENHLMKVVFISLPSAYESHKTA